MMTPRAQRIFSFAMGAIAVNVIFFLLWSTAPYILKVLAASFGVAAIFLVGVSEGFHHAEQQRYVMTTTVKIEAHCSDDEEVVIQIADAAEIVETITLQDGESAERYVYDTRVLSVCEQKREG